MKTEPEEIQPVEPASPKSSPEMPAPTSKRRGRRKGKMVRPGRPKKDATDQAQDVGFDTRDPMVIPLDVSTPPAPAPVETVNWDKIQPLIQRSLFGLSVLAAGAVKSRVHPKVMHEIPLTEQESDELAGCLVGYLKLKKPSAMSPEMHLAITAGVVLLAKGARIAAAAAANRQPAAEITQEEKKKPSDLSV